jgi:transposase
MYSGLREQAAKSAAIGVVRWRTHDLVMRLHEELGISVSNDMVYRALKDLSFSHVSALARAYKQDADAMEAFKKAFPPARDYRQPGREPAAASGGRNR